MKLKGKITKILANFYYVQDMENKTWQCFSRNRLLKEGKLLFVGDEVEIEISSPSQGVIVDLLNRKNKIIKPPIANIDQVLVVFSTCEPDFDFYNLDRYLSYVSYELPDEKIAVCINKIDLKKLDITENYKNSGFQIFYVSALTKEGLNDLSLELVNKTTVLTGPSGVGKSSLIKALAPDEDIKIGSLSAIKQGKHITRNVQLISIKYNNEQGFLVDTPGFTQFSFAALNPNKLLATFKELDRLSCSFNNCLHNGETGCVLEDLNKLKSIPESRFESYINMLEELKSEIAYGTKEESKIKSTGGRDEGKGKKRNIPKIDQETRSKSRKKEKQELLKLETETENYE
ncbi:MAG: ribosome small subunit-dependent GTPase A [Candidatus Melainabacteria bacterium]|nr:ribosome small subunit-dependent GTPase A [Candidatus Melainabacteria bacterium]